MTQSSPGRKQKPPVNMAGRDEPARGPAEDTKQRLIDAALDTFGRFGFDGASTREIARRAGVNLAAIPYHFGGKDGLHKAVAQHIVDEVAGRIGPAVEAVSTALDRGEVDPGQARDMLQMVTGNAVEVILGHPEASRWAPFVLREQMDPSPTFDVIYDGFLERMHKTMTALYARATGQSESAPESIAAVFMLFGQLVIFRMGRAMVDRRLGWKGYGEPEIGLVREVLRKHLDATIEAGRA